MYRRVFCFSVCAASLVGEELLCRDYRDDRVVLAHVARIRVSHRGRWPESLGLLSVTSRRILTRSRTTGC